MTKKCPDCGEMKTLTDFNKDGRRVGGFGYRCLACQRVIATEYRRANRDRIAAQRKLTTHRYAEQKRLYMKGYYQKTKEWQREKKLDARRANAQTTLERGRKYQTENKEKIVAHRKVEQAIKSGLLVKSPCIICGEVDTVAHHEDYAEQLDVTWLCRKHHAGRHYDGLQLIPCEEVYVG